MDMAGFFSWLVDSAKWATEERKTLAPIYGSWREHPAIGQWFPVQGHHSSVGTYRCYGCGVQAKRDWLTEVPQPANKGDICSVLMDRENDARRQHGLPPVE